MFVKLLSCLEGKKKEKEYKYEGKFLKNAKKRKILNLSTYSQVLKSMYTIWKF